MNIVPRSQGQVFGPAQHGVWPIPTNTFFHLYIFLLSFALFSITCCVHVDHARLCLLLVTGRTRHFLGTLCIFQLHVKMQFYHHACTNRDRSVQRQLMHGQLPVQPQTQRQAFPRLTVSVLSPFKISICSGESLSLPIHQLYITLN